MKANNNVNNNEESQRIDVIGSTKRCLMEKKFFFHFMVLRERAINYYSNKS